MNNIRTSSKGKEKNIEYKYKWVKKKKKLRKQGVAVTFRLSEYDSLSSFIERTRIG